MNKIEWKSKALKQLEKVKEIATRKQIFSTVKTTLVDFPHCQNVKKLTDHKYNYRLRVGNYRVFFEFDGDVKIIEIEEVKKRDEHTY